MSRQIKVESINHADIKSINSYETIIYIGALYAGGVLRMGKTFEKMTDCKNKAIIATVGLADPEDKENIDNIRKKWKTRYHRKYMKMLGYFIWEAV